MIKFKTQIDLEEAEIIKNRKSYELESNIKGTLYGSNNQNKLEACIRHIRDEDFYQLCNVNSNTIAILLGRSKLLEVTIQHHDILFGFSNKSLIQICAETNDIDSWNILMDKIIQTDSFINLETLNLLIEHEDSCFSFEYLRDL